jgi:aryl-alcohol dehydrogenase-like predicted oxidoreductase
MNNRIGIGTVQFGVNYGISNNTGQTSLEEVSNILSLAAENGIHVLDTARSYGESEKILGKFDLSNFKIVSKFLLSHNWDFVEKQLNQSLKNLKVDSLYGYLSHRASDVLENPDRWIELQTLKQKGMMQKIGFSFNTPDEAEKVIELKMYPDLVQIPYNYFDHRFEKHIVLFKSMGCEIHARSAFLQGLFFLPQEKLNPYFSLVAPIIKLLQEEHKDNLSGALLNYCFANVNIDYVIIGVNNSQQLIDNLKAMKNAQPLEMLLIEIPNHIITPSEWNK